ncbi:MAG: hypothetical protein IKR86_08465 [Candidatus Methanomethylophilaceae archaeon]|nr:hypothetical protein [Candidatus Methanomethylophilaceae archaeon]
MEMDPSAFLKADVGRRDLTTKLAIPDIDGTAHVICLEDAVIAGTDEASDVFAALGVDAEPIAKDGERVRAGSRIMSVSGPISGMLTCEATALGFLSCMSGVATAVSSAVEAGQGRIRVAVARTTVPGFGEFERKAVMVGGGDPYADALDSMVFLRRGHVAACGGVRNAMERISKASIAVKKGVEVVSAEEARVAASMGADIVRALGAGPEATADIFEAVRSVSDRIIVEASGSIRAGDVPDYIGKADVAILDRALGDSRPVRFSLDIA